MEANLIDQAIAQEIFGYVRLDFKPSQCERDAWVVVTWMYEHAHPLNIKRMAPKQICEQCLQSTRHPRQLVCA